MKKQRHPNLLKFSNRVKLSFGLVGFILLLAAIGLSFGSSMPMLHTDTLLLHSGFAPNFQQTEPTPGSSIYLPLLSNVNQPESTENWKTHDDAINGYSFSYPSDWDLTIGNAFDPSLPADTAAVRKGRRLAVICAVEDKTSASQLTSRHFEEVSSLGEKTYFAVAQGQLAGERVEVIQEGMQGQKMKLIYTFFPFQNRIYYVATIFLVDPHTGSPIDVEAAEELRVYDLIVSSFTIAE